MSSLKSLLGSGVSVALRQTKQRLVVNGLTSKNWFGSYNLSKQIQASSGRNLHGRMYPLLGRATSSLVNQSVGFHSTSSRQRNDARIDESLNRLDSEIRRVGRIRRQEVDEILGDIKEMKKATSSQSLMIIRCCGELIPEEPPNRRTELVQQVWKTLESLKVPMDVSHYNALLRVYLENEHKFNPTEFLQDLTNKGIEPNRVTYQRLIARFCQDGDIDGASTILQHMKDKQMPINEYVFNSLILGHGQANDMESAEGILGVMRQAGLEPNDDTYVTLMTCYAKNGDISNIHRIVKECEEKEVHLIDRDFLSVIHSLAGNNHQGLIDEILPYLKKHAGFNQDTTSLIYRLVNLGQEDIGYKMLKQLTPIMRNDDTVPSGNFFIKHLVQLSKPAETVIKYCKALEEEGLNKFALARAAEFALNSQNTDLAVEILGAMSDAGHPMRQHYFWPLFASASSEDGVYAAIRAMRGLNISPSTETLREYVIPAALKKSSDTVENTLNKLSRTSGVPLGTVTSAAMIHVLNQGETKLASQFATNFRIRFGNPQMRRAIVDSYIRSNDAKTFVQIIGSSVLDGDDMARESVGMMLMELVESTRSKKAALLEPVLKELLAQGLGLSNSASELLQNNLGEALTPELANSIIQLTSGELTPKISFFQEAQDPNRRQGMGQLEDRSTETLEQMLAEASRKNAPIKGIQKALVYAYCRERNVEKLDKLKADLDKEGFVYSFGMHAMLMDLYTMADKLEPAKEAFENLKKGLEFSIDDMKILRFATLLHSHGDMEGCLDVLKNTGRDESRKPQGGIQQATVWKLLNSIAETGDPEKVKEVFNILKERNLTTVNSITLGPIVKAYLIKDDLDGALKEFERCSVEYKATPWKQELFCRFINLEDADRLQKVMDLSTNIHGEVNSMYDLVFAFIDCGKLRQAKKILDTPGLRARNDKIELFCQKYFQDDRVSELENLIQVTKDLVDVDRNTMYFYLLQAYCKQGDPDKALSVWTSMQEESVQPSAELLIYLADFLRKSNRPVPFVVPDASEIHVESEGGSVQPSRSNSASVDASKGLSKSITDLRRAIDMNDIDMALQIKQRLDSEGTTISITDASNLVDKLAKAERLNEAMKLTDQMLERGAHPYSRTLRFFVLRLASAADINSLERLGDKLTDNLKRTVMYNSRLCLGYVNAGRGKEFFEKNIKPKVKSAAGTEEQTSENEERSATGGDDLLDDSGVPVFGSVNLLMKNKDLLPEFEQLIQDAHPIHRRSLNNSVWAYHMLTKDFDSATESWKNLQGESRVLYRTVIFEAKANNDPEMASFLASQVLTSTAIPPRQMSLALASALDLFVDNNRVDDALKLLEESLKVMKLEDYPRPPLIKLKELAQAQKKDFPYTIPPPRAMEQRRGAQPRDSSSSSDSD